VVAYLTVHGPSHREKLMDVFWPDRTYPHARANLCSIVRYARIAMGTVTPPEVTPLIQHQRGMYSLSKEPGWSTDLAMFYGALRAGRDAKAPDARIPAYRRAVDLYAGEALPGVYDRWAETVREEARTAYLEAAEELAGCLYSAGNYMEAVAAGRALIQAEPTWESAYRILMRSYAAMNRVDQIVLNYRRLCDVLQDQLEVAPSEESGRLFDELTSRRPSVA
jgi:DNA-binding SARP family transcriptional activator